jgi:hypothetical protein
MLPAIAEVNKVGTYFWINPERNIYGDVTDTFDIEINIANAPATFAWGLKLSWNTSVLNVTGASEGTFLSQGMYPTSFFSTPPGVANGVGSMAIECTAITPNPGNSGNGWLCNVTFLVVGSGRSALSLDDTFLVDLSLVSTDYPNNDGYFCTNDAFSCLHDVYVVSVDVNNTEPQQGEIVEITVIVHNEGNHIQDVIVYVYADLVTHDPLDADVVAVGDEIVIYTTPVPITLLPCVPEPIVILWDTTPVPGETWTISAEVEKLEPDNDPHDNIYIGPNVKVTSTHDIKVKDVTVITPKVHKGDIAQVNVTVHNEGKVPEDVRVILFAEDKDLVMNFTGPGVLTVCEYYTWIPLSIAVPEPCTCGK